MTGEFASLERVRLGPGAGRLAGAVPALKRYGMSAGGPISTSGAHFLASLILLRTLPPAEFGLFAFVLVVVPFALSLSGAVIGASFVTDMSHGGVIAPGSLATHLKANLVVSVIAAVAVAAAMRVSDATPTTALFLGLYGGLMTVRLFGRTYGYASGQPLRVLFCDLTYSALLISGLVVLLAMGALTMAHVAAVLAGSALLCQLALGRAHFGRQLRPGRAGTLMDYAGHWRDMARWAFAGVVLTEFTANAHAYIVTFVAGSKAFALLALGALALRPASLVLSSLPDIELPRIAIKIGEGRIDDAFRIVKDFRTAAAAVWFATLMLAGGLLIWFPHVLLKKGYDLNQALAVIAIWAVILAVRMLRTPESVLLQAAGEFRALAGASVWSCVTSVVATLGLLLAAGPIAALGGIFAGDLVMTANIFALTRRWRRTHG